MLKVLKRFRMLFACFAFAIAICSIATASSPMVAYALEDNLGGQNGSSSSGGISDLSSKDQGLVDAMTGWDGGMSGQDFAKASTTMAPLTNLIGYAVGIILVLVFAGVFLITALDLLYLAIPPFRNALYKGGQAGGMQGGMQGGYGGMQQQSGVAAKLTQWISDEAVQCASMLGGGAQSQPMGGGPGMGGYGMGGYGMQQQGMQQGAQQGAPMKSVIGMYCKKRMFFMVFLAVSALVLTSSILMKTGINLGAWVLKIFNTLNNKIPM